MSKMSIEEWIEEGRNRRMLRLLGEAMQETQKRHKSDVGFGKITDDFFARHLTPDLGGKVTTYPQSWHPEWLRYQRPPLPDESPSMRPLADKPEEE